jgi:CRISPR-associated protein Csb2
LDLDQDGRLDHFLIHTPMGMGDVAQRAIGRLRRTWTKGRSGDLFVAAVGLGDRGDIGAALLGQRNDPGLLDLAVNWISHTPFIAPRHVKRHKHSLESQVRAELADRGFPEPSSIEVGSREALLASGFLNFVRERRQSAKRPPTTQPWLLRLCFAEPVPGPIAIGYGCHYGLGVFRPFVDRSTDLVRSTL